MDFDNKNHELLRQGLDLLREGLTPFVERELRGVYGEAWEQEARNALNTPSHTSIHWDSQALLNVIDRLWREVFRRKLERKHRSWVIEAVNLRHDLCHEKKPTFSDRETERGLDTIEWLLMAVSAPESQGVSSLKAAITTKRSTHSEPIRLKRLFKVTDARQEAPPPRMSRTNAVVIGNVPPSTEWNGECYANFSSDQGSRVWADAIQYGFLSGGGRAWYNRTLRSLQIGERVWVNIASYGYVGVGVVTRRAEPHSNFKVKASDGRLIPVLDAQLRGSYGRHLADNPDRCEYFVSMQWLQTVPLERAVHEPGFFGNQNTVCRPTTAKWRFTVEQLKQKFPDYASV
jgi:hypothetical protein